MKRKVIKQGNNTLTITLPRKWTSKQNISAGDEINLEEKGSGILIAGQTNSKEREICVKIDNLDRTTVHLLIQGMYCYGYDSIEIHCNSTVFPHYRLKKNVGVGVTIYELTNRLVGAEVIQASKNHYIIKRIAEESFKDFPTVLRRIFLLVLEMMETFIGGAEQNDHEILRSIEFQHNNLKKFINFCLRLLNKYGHEDSKQTCFYFTIISLLSKIEDIVKNASRYMMTFNLSIEHKEAFNLLQEIQSSFKQYYALFYNYQLGKISELDEHRDTFRNHLFSVSPKLSKEENVLLGGLSQIIELILDMTEIRMGMEE